MSVISELPGHLIEVVFVYVSGEFIMTDQPLVSIVVPVYNTEKYLSDCLESLLAQTEKNIEILAVDDGSSDGSPAVLRRYAANCPQIRIFTQKTPAPAPRVIRH